MARLCAICTGIVALGCDANTDSVGSGDFGAVESIVVRPSSAILHTHSESTEVLQFTAEVGFESGEVVPDFELIEWSLSNISAGEIDDTGAFFPSITNGGRTWVTASAGGVSATADLLVVYEEEVLTADVPSGVDAVFESTGELATGLVFAYPEDGVALPRNLQSPTFMWRDSVGANLYRLEFSSETTTVVVYTLDPEWAATETLWRTITATNAGGEVSVALSAASVQIADGEITAVDAIFEGPTLRFLVNRLDAEGAIYYFATSRSGIMRAGVEDPEPSIWFSQIVGNTDDRCVGCHVIGPHGERMSYAWSDDNVDRQGLAEISDTGDVDIFLEQNSTRDTAYFSTFDPTGEYLVYSSDGVLSVYDGATGQFMHEIQSSLSLTMPHWSPDGSMLVAVAGRDMVSDLNFAEGHLVILDHLGDAEFSEPWTLTEIDILALDYYPVFSPDSRWVAYNRTYSRQMNFAEDAALWLVEAVEGATPIELVRANRAEGITNSWPRWGPVPDDDVFWLTFASNRDYGLYDYDAADVDCPGEEPDCEHAQIWVSGIDTQAAEAGSDPSLPAYRFPQQEWLESNHAPLWSLY